MPLLAARFTHRILFRYYSVTNSNRMQGLILGVFENKNGQGYELSDTAKQFDDQNDNCISQKLPFLGSSLKKGSSQLFYGLTNSYPCISLVNVGKRTQGYNEQEQWNDMKQSVRTCTSVGSRSLRNSTEVTAIEVDSCGEPQAAAEGCVLGLYSYDELKKESSRKKTIKTSLFSLDKSNSSMWEKGVMMATSQNIARRLTDAPANHMTPIIFSENVEQIFNGIQSVEVIARDKKWAEEKKMGLFLSVAQGSSEPPRFIETHYRGADPSKKPIVLVGKGITFDTGGISLKPAANLDKMRADMGGAACVIGVIHALSTLKIPVNVIGLTPMTENMPGNEATKPGDVFTAMNGKTVQVDNTDAEGRLVLADGLCYAHTFNPSFIMDMATLTGAIKIALGCSAAGAFTTCTRMFDLLLEASKDTGDRVWRLPVFDLYSSQLKSKTVADLNNIGAAVGKGGASVAAAFLKEFVSINNWMHLDISGVKENSNEVPHLGKGFTGRPLRTIVEFINALSQEPES